MFEIQRELDLIGNDARIMQKVYCKETALIHLEIEWCKCTKIEIGLKARRFLLIGFIQTSERRYLQVSEVIYGII